MLQRKTLKMRTRVVRLKLNFNTLEICFYQKTKNVILLLDDSKFNGAANRLQGLTVNTIAVVTE
jgi:hypothetical protein